VLAYVGSGFSRKGVATALRAIVAHPDVWLLIAAINMRVSSKSWHRRWGFPHE
jgi:UDP-glucose:(heptosyl)LPS alpha-1,3-glucosyltransferase